jgi:hypothetical protein
MWFGTSNRPQFICDVGSVGIKFYFFPFFTCSGMCMCSFFRTLPCHFTYFLVIKPVCTALLLSTICNLLDQDLYNFIAGFIVILGPILIVLK